MSDTRALTDKECAEIDKEFNECETLFRKEAYMDGELVAVSMDTVDTLAFNTWAFLVTAEPKFDEVRIRVATDEEVEEWNKE